MINKEKYISFINNEDAKNTIIKNFSKIESAVEKHEIKKTDFMNPYEQRLFKSILNAFKDKISFSVFLEREGIERKLFLIYPFYENIDNYLINNYPISLIRIYGDFSKINHKDVLGAIMSLGIVREKTGDIFINKNSADIIVDNIQKNYILLNLEKIKKVKINSEELNVNNIKISKPITEEKIIIVSSLRLDNIISSVFNINREKSKLLIKNKYVKVNYEPIVSSSMEVLNKSLISVRKYGRFFMEIENKFTKKGKNIIKINIFK